MQTVDQPSIRTQDTDPSGTACLSSSNYVLYRGSLYYCSSGEYHLLGTYTDSHMRVSQLADGKALPVDKETESAEYFFNFLLVFATIIVVSICCCTVVKRVCDHWEIMAGKRFPNTPAREEEDDETSE